MSKKIKEIYSQAFPPKIRKRQKEYSNCHSLLAKEEIDKSKIKYRLLKDSDIEEIYNLHREWFPVKYEKQFFKEVIENTNKAFYSVCAEYTLNDGEKIIIGCILVEFQYISGKFLRHSSREIMDKISKEISFYDDALCNFQFTEYHAAYIMTLGVIDEFRKMKIGSSLIELTRNFCLKDYLCVCIFLDVICYNTGAINFYRRNNFEEVTTINNYYKLEGTLYDSYVFVKKITKKEKSEHRFNNSSFIYKYFLYYIFYFLLVIYYFLTFGFCFRRLRKNNKLD